MRADILLCPCCASHLRPPPELRLMRCDHCRADLAMIHEGGVAGLAIVPAIGDVPYSTPEQRTRPAHQPVNTAELLSGRRMCRLAAARRRLTRWTTLSWITVTLGAAIVSLGATGMYALVHRTDTNIENATLAVLAAMIALPVLVYVALFFQSRGALARAEVVKWKS